jgi:hypothetical protein
MVARNARRSVGKNIGLNFVALARPLQDGRWNVMKSRNGTNSIAQMHIKLGTQWDQKVI